MVKIKDINTYSDDYLYYYDTWNTLADFREGSPAVTKVPWKYLKKKVVEDNDVYQARLDNLIFTPVMSRAIRSFVTTIEKAPLSLTYTKETTDSATNFWKEYAKNVDGKNTTAKAWLIDVFATLLYFGRVYSAVEMPVQVEARSAYEEEQNLVLPEVVNFEPLSVIDYSEGEWYKIRQIVTRSSPLNGKKRYLQYRLYDAESIRIYEIEIGTEPTSRLVYKPIPDFNSVNYESIRTVVSNGVQVAFTEDTDIPLVETIYHNLGKPPVIAKVIKPELWAGKDVYSKQAQYMVIESSYMESGTYAGSIVRIFTPQPSPNLNDPRSLSEPTDYGDLQPDNNHILIGANYQLVESKGDALKNLEGQLNKIEAQIKSIVNLDYSSSGDSASAKRQSGEAKEYDHDLWESCIKHYGELLKVYHQDLFNLIGGIVSKAPPIVTGLSSFKLDNINDLLDQASKLPGDLPPTARRIWMERLVVALLGDISSEDAATIATELAEKVEAQKNLDPAVQEILDIPGMTGKDAAQVLRGGFSALEQAASGQDSSSNATITKDNNLGK